MQTLTNEEFNALLPYRKELECARAHYLRSVGLSGQELLRAIYKRVTGEDYRRIDVCGQCELALMEIVAGWFFATPAPVVAAPKRGRKPRNK